MNHQKKMVWEKPEITIVSRSNPDEAVLKACSSPNTQAANIKDGQCVIKGVDCAPCETPTTS
jgi:hypothetical protein